MGQRFFAIDVLAHFDSSHSNNRMSMVRRSNNHRIDALLFIQHPAEVVIFLGIGILFEHPCSIFIIHITEGDDILAADLM